MDQNVMDTNMDLPLTAASTTRPHSNSSGCGGGQVKENSTYNGCGNERTTTTERNGGTSSGASRSRLMFDPLSE